MIGIGPHDLAQAGEPVQGYLFRGLSPSDDRFDKALDAVRDRFGYDAIVKGHGSATKLVRQGPSKVE